MRLHRFFSHETIPEQRVEKIEGKDRKSTNNLITHKLANDQWRRVFRFGPGDRVILFDGSANDYVCEIKEYQGGNAHDGGEVILKIIEVNRNNVKPIRDVSLYAAIVKKDTFEWIAEKATELGVSNIVPVVAERSEKKNLNMERLEKIVIEASEQSGRSTVPSVHSVIDLNEALTDIVKRKQPAIVFDPSGVLFSEKDFGEVGDVGGAGKNRDARTTAVFIGPEGGWSADELKTFEKSGIKILSLGPQILRAETAVVAALSRLVF
jgi:16S rRNA (uracil1498-N3)-methyltransferase